MGATRNLPPSGDIGIETDKIEEKSQDGEEAEVQNEDVGRVLFILSTRVLYILRTILRTFFKWPIKRSKAMNL